MAELSTLARPYAKAAFGAAVETNDLAAWSKALSTLAAILKVSAVSKLIADPVLSSLAKAEALAGVAGEDFNEGARNLLTVLAENDRFLLIGEVYTQFEALRADYESRSDVVVTSAFSLSEAQQQALSDKLSKKFDKQVSMTVKVDAALIGGVIIKAGDLVIDGSVRGKLSKLADAMNS